MKIEFVTDFVCPYCIVATEAIKKVARDFDLDVEIETIPFELTVEPKERVDTYSDPVRREHYKVLEEPSRVLGLDAKFPPRVIPRPYSRLAFEGWHFAEENGKGDVYADAVYAAYFIDEQDIGEPDVLTAIAEKAGLDPTAFREALEQGTYTAKQKEAREYSRNVLGVSSVPTIYVDGKKIELESYMPEEVMKKLMERQAEENSGGFFGCGEDGC